jgi:excisionase family DNA binding protein
MTPSEAARYLKVTRQTIYRWCDEGRLKFYELESGGGRRFKREDLDALLKEGKR